MTARAATVIESLGLRPHPEGGYYGEIYRSPNNVKPNDERGERPGLTSIYFLLVAGEPSSWHVLRSDEVWHHYEGDPLELLVIDPESLILDRKLLGPLDDGQKPIQTVPAGHWQAARSLGDYTLVGCTVAPGFVYEDFRMVRDHPADAAMIRVSYADLADLL